MILGNNSVTNLFLESENNQEQNQMEKKVLTASSEIPSVLQHSETNGIVKG